MRRLPAAALVYQVRRAIQILAARPASVARQVTVRAAVSRLQPRFAGAA
jgi:hypothetical protein